MKQLLIRADDLGYSQGVNYGIEKTVREGIIRSVGVMTNMPDTIHGLNLLKDRNVCYGLHTNICVGYPLSEPERIPSLCQENGQFLPSSVFRTAQIDPVVLEEALIEIEAQYQRFLDLVGEKPRYFEGHAVRSANFFRGLRIIAERHGCDFLDNPPSHTPVFRHTVLHAIMDSVLPGYDPVATVKRAALAEYEDGGISMVIFHPGFLDAYLLRTSSMLNTRPAEVEAACSEALRGWLKENDVVLITYDDIR